MNVKAAVITVSDKGSRGEREDTSGPAVAEMLREAGIEVSYQSIIPDEQPVIEAELKKCADTLGLNLVVTTGGTGFSPRDVTPEATLAVVERETRGIPEAMRAESMRITPRGCLSRAAAGIRGRTLIVNLPGSKKAALENLGAVMDAIDHGMDMLASAGSADCADPAPAKESFPSVDAWLREAKADKDAGKIGMYLLHNGTVRETARAAAREGKADLPPIRGMEFSYDRAKVDAAIAEARALPGISLIRVWLNQGELKLGDDIMVVLIGGDIRPRVVAALEFLVGKIKSECVTEKEVF
ncbi:MAG: molybdenum cofactor biosynthesis protein MoaE [Oscillospiraceae bacterium]|nr:molybdenum cofactor biosynthesis protein MoaE [Oscillospiraceae bacterium]